MPHKSTLDSFSDETPKGNTCRGAEHVKVFAAFFLQSFGNVKAVHQVVNNLRPEVSQDIELVEYGFKACGTSKRVCPVLYATHTRR